MGLRPGANRVESARDLEWWLEPALRYLGKKRCVGCDRGCGCGCAAQGLGCFFPPNTSLVVVGSVGTTSYV